MALAKIRAGMGDVDSESVEVWSDEDEARATGLLQLLGPDGRLVGAPPKLEPALLRELHRGMLRARVLDEKMLLLQRQGRIAFYAEARGQEAAVIGAIAALESNDYVVPAHRELGAALYRGLPIANVVAQLYGNAHDVARGRQMPVHLATPRALRFIPPSSCVATQLPHAAGLAWAAKMRRDPVVVLAYLGEGATSAEDFHAGVNFAAVYRAPCVFLCENNQWAISTPASRQTASRTFAIKALAYGMPGVRVDGNDVLAVHATVREAAARARVGGGPTLIEAVTYRLGAHSSSDDPHRYRSEADEASWKGKDPLERFSIWLAATGTLDAAGAAAQRAAVEAEIAAAVEAEEGIGPPPLRSLIENVFAQPPAALEEQLADLERVRASAPASHDADR
ncbi:MAG TPA: thiamine pyrophosphate-dependent enzyme [Polyangia bacterium]|nr:thiamine pyrophosphate-dependent enzyme [Polyangia bacterium]